MSHFVYMSMMILRMILTEVVSELHINFSKDSLFPVNPLSNIHQLVSIKQCNIASLSHDLSRISFGGKAQIHQHVEWGSREDGEKKVGKLKKAVFTLRGKSHSHQQFFDALATYTMSLFQEPMSILKRMDRLRRDFLWKGNKQGKPLSHQIGRKGSWY